jgi:hypothetical protein
MTPNPADFENPNFGAGDSGRTERVHDLTWALFDDYISDDQFVELQALLLNDSVARDAYIRCAQLHADLTTHFAAALIPEDNPPTKTPILGVLNQCLPQFGTPPVRDATP